MMRRLLLLLVLASVAWIALAPAVFAQENAAAPAGGAAAAPDPTADFTKVSTGWSGPGFYLNLFKFIPAFLIFLLWVWSTDWVSRDAVELHFDYNLWNSIVVGIFLVAFILLWLIPIFWVGLPLVVVAYAAPLITYIVYHNKHVEEHQKVWTREHLRFWFAKRMNKVGMKVDAEKKDPHESGVPVVLAAHEAPTERDSNARLLGARQSPGLLPARKILADALYRRADALMLDYTQQGAAVRFLVDGIWQNGEPLDRETGDPLLESLKILSGLNPMDRQSRQEGKFLINYTVFQSLVFQAIERAREEFRKQVTLQISRELAGQGEVNPAMLEQQVKMLSEQRARERFATPIGPWTPVEKTDLVKVRGTEKINPENALNKMRCIATLACQGTPTGERVLIQLEVQQTLFTNPEQIGMRPKMYEQFKELSSQDHGFVLISAPPGNGLRTTTYVLLRSADRFTREFAAAESENLRYDPVENVPVTVYRPTQGQTLAAVLPEIFHKEPAVLVVRDLVDVESTKMLLEQAVENRMIVTTMRAKDSVEAICRVIALGVPAADVAKTINCVLNQRLIRKLCENCKEAYAPPPQVLAQLGLPPGRVPAFYRPPQQREEVCPECNGMGYRGRTAIFELLAIDDNLRKLLAGGANPDAVREAARKGGFRSLQEEGVVLVAKGTTSLQELIRVMKQ